MSFCHPEHGDPGIPEEFHKDAAGGTKRITLRDERILTSSEPAESKDLPPHAPLRSLLSSAAARLRSAGIDTPDHDAKLLLAEAIGCELRDVDKAMLMGESVEQMLRLRPPASAQHDSSGDSASCHPEWCSKASTPCHPERSPEGAESKDLSALLTRFETMLARRAAREPLQHIVGHAPFRWLDLKVGPGVFIPRPETETVVQAGLDWLAVQGLASPRVVDLCAGSGAIGLAVATEMPRSEVWAVELSAQTIAWTRRNAAETLGCDRSSPNPETGGQPDDLSDPTAGLSAFGFAAPEARPVSSENKPIASGAKQAPTPPDSFGHGRYHLVRGDATAAETLAELDGTIDAVITNPPYVPLDEIPEQPEARDHDPALALFGGSPDGTAIPERIIERAATLLCPGGLLVMEHDITQGAALISHALANGFAAARTERDLTGRDRFLVACRG